MFIAIQSLISAGLNEMRRISFSPDVSGELIGVSTINISPRGGEDIQIDDF